MGDALEFISRDFVQLYQHSTHMLSVWALLVPIVLFLAACAAVLLGGKWGPQFISRDEKSHCHCECTSGFAS